MAKLPESLIDRPRSAFAQPVYMFFVDLEKAFDRVSWYFVGGAVGVWGSGPIATGYPVSTQ